jgi:tRNA-specific 2-thiouridylase
MNGKAKDSGKTVIVGLTGRTDSAVAAFLLQKQGFKVIGLSIVSSEESLVYDKKDLPICHISNLESVKEFCERIGIQFYATNAVSRYNSEIVDKLISNKILGKANTSCFNCVRNRFEILYEKMKVLKADFIATGHYAKVHKNHTTEESFIHPNLDVESDQSFLLAGLSHHVLEHLLLPLGELRKIEVNKIAKKFNLNTKESLKQVGFCFRTKESAKKILDTQVPKSLKRPGPIENTLTEVTVGEHESMIYHYITEKDLQLKDSQHVDKNLEIIGYDDKSSTIFLGEKKNLTFKGTQLIDMHFAKHFDISKPLGCFVKFKYSNDFNRVDLYFKNNKSAIIEFHNAIYPLIQGEIIVFYDKNSSSAKIIGWGMIGKRGDFEKIDRTSEFRRSYDDEGEVIDRSFNYWKF